MARQNMFPYLPSTSQPMGVLEQLSVAITLRPLQDGAVAALQSWFGRLLSENASFKWTYRGDRDSFEYDRAQIAEAYFSNRLRYTVFAWNTTGEEYSEDGVVLRIWGTLSLKGLNGGKDHCGNHKFTFKLIKELSNKWRLLECHIEQTESKCFGHSLLYE